MPLFVFSVTLFLAVLISCRAERSVLSTSVLFLAAGLMAGHGGLSVVQLEPGSPVVERFVEFALFSVLFTDGMRISAQELRSAWRLPGRTLVFGLPLTLAAAAVLARFLLGAPWSHSFLIGAALSPTDPVFASALVGREDVPARLRELLNVESGFNDGLALPVVLLLIGSLSRAGASVQIILLEIAGGILLGIVLPYLAVRLVRLPAFGVASRYQPLTGFAVGVLILSISTVTHVNTFLAAFAGGITLAHISPETKQAFHQFGDLIAELFKLAALMIFGSLISWEFVSDIGWTGLLFAVLMLVLVRPLAVSISLLGGGLSWREWIAAAWFGPRGFATVFFSLLILGAGVPSGVRMYHLLAIVVAVSIVAHSSSDVPVARWFRRVAAAESNRSPAPVK
jgi:sodium/hydrogen antiporter